MYPALVNLTDMNQRNLQKNIISLGVAKLKNEK